MAKVGRPSDYDPVTAALICEKVAAGDTLARLGGSEIIHGKPERYPSVPTLYKWLRDYSEFLNLYEVARTVRAHARADRIDEIARQALAGEVEVAAAALAIRAETWQAARENPRSFGDKLEVAQSGTVVHEHKLNMEEIEKMEPADAMALAEALGRILAPESSQTQH